MHYWSVWHGGESFDAYYRVIPRFCSEFGYQSFPSLDTIRTYASEDQFNVSAPVMEHHQRNRGGNSKITEMFTRYFRFPERFENFVYLSQVQQALAIKTGVEHWRHLRPTCMGTVYWQLNDNWPVCSWSSLEYNGKWKILHYFAKRFFAPTILSVFQRADDTLELWLTNDAVTPKTVETKVAVHDFDGNPLFAVTGTRRVAAATAKRLKTFKLADLIDDACAGFMELTLGCDGETIRNTHFFRTYKQCDLRTVRTFRLKYAIPSQAFDMVDTLKSDIGRAYVDPNSGTVMVCSQRLRLTGNSSAQSSFQSSQRSSWPPSVSHMH